MPPFLRSILPESIPTLPSIITTPEPLGVKLRLIFESPPVEDIVGPLPIAAFVTSI